MHPSQSPSAFVIQLVLEFRQCVKSYRLTPPKLRYVRHLWQLAALSRQPFCLESRPVKLLIPLHAHLCPTSQRRLECAYGLPTHASIVASFAPLLETVTPSRFSHQRSLYGLSLYLETLYCSHLVDTRTLLWQRQSRLSSCWVQREDPPAAPCPCVWCIPGRDCVTTCHARHFIYKQRLLCLCHYATVILRF